MTEGRHSRRAARAAAKPQGRTVRSVANGQVSGEGIRKPSGKRRGGRGTGCAIAALATVAVIVLVGVVGVSLFLSDTTPAGVVAGTEVPVTIAEGSGTAAIASVLAQDGIIENALVFRIKSRLDGNDGKYRAGTYQMTVGMGYDRAMQLLMSGPRADYVTVTVPEGLTGHLVAQLMETKMGIPYDEFMGVVQSGSPEFEEQYPFLKGAYGGSLEGFLYPETYQFDVGSDAKTVVGVMLQQFDSVWSSLDIPADRLDRYTVYELVTIASMVEREARLDNERPLVASVIDNRLDRDMMLQFCSTVQFLLPGEEERTKIRLTNKDISIDSPYNTYRNKGLPPGPIANPGRAALEAALNPADTNYLFFVLTGKDGSQTFSETAAEHAAATQISKEVLGQ